MVFKNFFSLFADSDFLGRPYKINRLLFAFLAIFILVAGLYIRNEQQYYPLAECASASDLSCTNLFYHSEFCKLDTTFKLQPICTQETIYRNPETHIAELGLHAPWYVENYSWWVIGLFIFAVLFNTLVHNFHLFRKQDAKEKADFVAEIEIGPDGQPIVKPIPMAPTPDKPVVYVTGDQEAAKQLADDLNKKGEVEAITRDSEVQLNGNINPTDNGQGKTINPAILAGSSKQSINVRDKSGEDEVTQESSVKDSIKQNELSAKPKARGRPGKGKSKN